MSNESEKTILNFWQTHLCGWCGAWRWIIHKSENFINIWAREKFMKQRKNTVLLFCFGYSLKRKNLFSEWVFAVFPFFVVPAGRGEILLGSLPSFFVGGEMGCLFSLLQATLYLSFKPFFNCLEELFEAFLFSALKKRDFFAFGTINWIFMNRIMFYGFSCRKLLETKFLEAMRFVDGRLSLWMNA